MMKDNFDKLDLGLTLGNSNPCLQIKLKSNKGAGVNAGTREDMVFAASDPLSELVWSPHKGLSLKCADSSVADKPPLLLWNVGPSNLPQSHSQNIRSGECNDKKSTVEDNKIVAKVAFHIHQELLKETDLHMGAQRETRPDNGTNYRNRMESTSKEEMNTSGEVYEVNAIRNSGHHGDPGENNLRNNSIRNTTRSSDHTAGQGDKRILNFLPLGRCDTYFGFAVSKPLSHQLEGRTSTSCSGRIEDIGFEGVITSVGMVMASEGHFVNGYKAPVSPLRNSLSETEVAQARQENQNKMTNHGLVCHDFLEKLEFTAENDLLPPVQAEALGQSKERLKREKPLAIKASPSNSRMDFCRRKGKEKAFSKENVGERVSNQEEESYESVESSNSAGLYTGRKRCNPEESMAGRKKVKKDTEDTLASRSTMRHDSSFMNWISNMVKGSRVDQEEKPSLALTIAPDPQRESDRQEMTASNRKFDGGCQKMGFRTMFQSLYCPGIRNSELEASKSDELVLSNNASVSIPQLSCPNNKVESSQNNFMSKENVDAPVSGDIACLSHKLLLPVNATPVQAVHNVNSAGNIASSHSLKDGANLSDSSCKQRNSEPDNCSPDLLSEGKETYDKSLGNYKLSSLWITRLTTKNSSSSLQLDYGNQCEHGRAGSNRFDDKQITSNISCGQKTLVKRDNSNEEAVNVLSEDLKNLAENVEESALHKEVPGHNCLKMDAIIPYSKFKSSDAMASVFARRLDALKHISPSGEGNTQFKEGNEKYSFEKMAGPPLDAANRILTCSGVGSLIKNLQIPGKGVSSSNDIKQCIASDYVACTPKESQILPICSSIGNQTADVPDGLFDAIRKLRLSRVEILKWMNCNDALSPLDGFFLRLRLGKLEGLGGTGYHVSRVTGYDNSSKDSKNPISVNVGGIQCLVGVQYISNHDFLEDELVAWWCSSLKNGLNLPSKEDLESKLEERKQMGL